MRESELLEWLSTLPAGERDRALEEHLGIVESVTDASPPGPDLIGYHASGIAAIVQALASVPVQREDVFVDLGAGLGKVVLVAHLLTGVAARGIELQPALAERARAAARRLGAAVEFCAGDARNADLASGTVFYLYAPFTGRVLREVLARLLCVASEHAIVVCALGVDLDRAAPWLVPRPSDSFWLTVYDSAVRGVPARPTAQCALPRRFTDIVALEA